MMRKAIEKFLSLGYVVEERKNSFTVIHEGIHVVVGHKSPRSKRISCIGGPFIHLEDSWMTVGKSYRLIKDMKKHMSNVENILEEINDEKIH